MKRQKRGMMQIEMKRKTLKRMLWLLVASLLTGTVYELLRLIGVSQDASAVCAMLFLVGGSRRFD